MKVLLLINGNSYFNYYLVLAKTTKVFLVDNPDNLNNVDKEHLILCEPPGNKLAEFVKLGFKRISYLTFTDIKCTECEVIKHDDVFSNLKFKDPNFAALVDGLLQTDPNYKPINKRNVFLPRYVTLFMSELDRTLDSFCNLAGMDEIERIIHYGEVDERILKWEITNILENSFMHKNTIYMNITTDQQAKLHLFFNQFITQGINVLYMTLFASDWLVILVQTDAPCELNLEQIEKYKISTQGKKTTYKVPLEFNLFDL